MSIALIYASYYCFLNNANDILVTRFGFTAEDAGFILSNMYICSAVLSPVVGKIVDKYGKRAIFMIISVTILLGSHLTVAFLSDTEYPNHHIFVCIVMYVVFYAFFASIAWSCIPLVVEEKMLGTAFGIGLASMNTMLSITPLAVAWIRDMTMEMKRGYFWTQIFLVGLAGIALIVTILIKVLDTKKMRLSKTTQVSRSKY